MRNALARFDQVSFEDDAARERARQKLLRAAKKYGIVPIGFFDGQLRKERIQTERRVRASDVSSLPRGTVTFLLTDIEGPTHLVRHLGDGYAAVLREVRTIIRGGVQRACGHEVDARGDEFFAVFRRTPMPSMRRSRYSDRSESGNGRRARTSAFASASTAAARR